MNQRELERAADEFLREHDTKYDKRSKRGVEYPYLSNRQFEIRCSKEIPLSNLSNRQRSQVPHLSDGQDYIER